MEGLPPLREESERYGLLALHPKTKSERLQLFTNGICRIPELVLRKMEIQRKAAELAAWSLESPIAIANCILKILEQR